MEADDLSSRSIASKTSEGEKLQAYLSCGNSPEQNAPNAAKRTETVNHAVLSELDDRTKEYRPSNRSRPSRVCKVSELQGQSAPRRSAQNSGTSMFILKGVEDLIHCSPSFAVA